MRARYLEAYLYGSPPDCKLAAYEFGVVGAPSEGPTLKSGELRTRWWQFWKPATWNV
jgi:hypothetical protein